MDNAFVNRIKKTWDSITHHSEDEELSGADREKIIVFAICILLAFCLWMVVNLNRDYNINIDVPVSLGNISNNKALTDELPQNVTASITGNGWDLINTYKNPPHVYIDVSSEDVNLFEQVRQQISSTSNVTVQKVQPLYLQVKLEDKASKKVPVKANVDLKMPKQYGLVDAPVITPDSVEIRGAASHISGINSWPTDSLSFNDVRDSFARTVGLKESNSLVSLSEASVTYRANVAQFTEGEVVVPVETRDFPADEVVTFSPSAVHVKYRIPLSEYTEFSKNRPFAAYVSYDQIQADTTGFVTPQIEKLPEKAHLKLKAVQPQQVAYFMIVGE